MRVHNPKLRNKVHTISLRMFDCFQRIRALYFSHIKFGFDLPSGIIKKSFENVDARTDGRTDACTDACTDAGSSTIL